MLGSGHRSARRTLPVPTPLLFLPPQARVVTTHSSQLRLLSRTLTWTSHTLAVMLDVTSTPPGMASSAPGSGPRVTPAALSAVAFAFSLASDSSSSLFCQQREFSSVSSQWLLMCNTWAKRAVSGVEADGKRVLPLPVVADSCHCQL